jgi:phosphatidylglycerophosphate synthase
MIATIAVMFLMEMATWAILPVAFPVSLICNILIWISVAFTIISGVVYLMDNKKFIDPSK